MTEISCFDAVLTLPTVLPYDYIVPELAQQSHVGFTVISRVSTGLSLPFTQLAYRFNWRTAKPLGPSPAPGCDEPTSYMVHTFIWGRLYLLLAPYFSGFPNKWDRDRMISVSILGVTPNNTRVGVLPPDVKSESLPFRVSRYGVNQSNDLVTSHGVAGHNSLVMLTGS